MFRLISAINSKIDWLSSIIPKQNTSKQKHKTHDLTASDWGYDYIYEPIAEGRGGYMTGHGRRIKRGDYLILTEGDRPCRYQVVEIDYYSKPSDIWTALLKKV